MLYLHDQELNQDDDDNGDDSYDSDDGKDANGDLLPLWSRSEPMHYAAIEINRDLNKSVKVIALLLLIFGPNLMILFFTSVKP